MYIYEVIMLIEAIPTIPNGFKIKQLVDGELICKPTHIRIDKDTNEVEILQLCMPLANSHRMVYEILVALEELDLHDIQKIKYTCLDHVQPMPIYVHRTGELIWEIHWIGDDMRPREEKVDVRHELNSSILKNYVRVSVSPVKR